MIKEFVNAWNKRKDELREYIATDPLILCGHEYDYLVWLLFERVINPEMKGFDFTYRTDDITVLDHGDYQGTQVFVLHKDKFQPAVEDYVYTSTYYGSCSGCDTLMHIIDDECDFDGEDEGDKIPNSRQVEDLMTLMLHLLQRCRRMGEDEV